MPHEKTEPVTPKGGYIDYQDDRLGRPLDTLDKDEIMAPASLEQAFHANACETDGCSGKLPIDTLYENFVESEIDQPRSDMSEGTYASGGTPNHEGTNNPAPRDTKRGLYPHRRY